MRRPYGGQTGQTRVLWKPAPGDDGAERVEQHQLRRSHRARRQRVETKLGGAVGETVEIIHQRIAVIERRRPAVAAAPCAPDSGRILASARARQWDSA